MQRNLCVIRVVYLIGIDDDRQVEMGTQSVSVRQHRYRCVTNTTHFHRNPML